jgi:predicted membrane protein
MMGSSRFGDTLRTVLLVVLAFFVSLILVDTIFEVIFATVVFYMFWHYYRLYKSLQRQVNEGSTSLAGTSAPAPPSDGNLPPSSTDA